MDKILTSIVFINIMRLFRRYTHLNSAGIRDSYGPPNVYASQAKLKKQQLRHIEHNMLN